MSTVTEHLHEKHVPHATFSHARTFTAKQEARALGVDADDVAKTVVLVTSTGPAICVVAASRMLVVPRIRSLLKDHTIRLASEREIKETFPSFELGALPPLGSLVGVPVYVDREIAAHDSIVFESGTQTESVRMLLEDVLAEPGAKVLPLTQPSFDQDWME